MPDALDADDVRRWCRVAADSLGQVRGEIDALNVFPVPDGDTGTNLHLTMLAAAESVEALGDDADLVRTWQTLARAALLGARGNSGVIVSQVLRGLADMLSTAVPSPGEAFQHGLAHAVAVAYDAVGEPVEGTVLSVLRAASEHGETAARAGDDLPAVARAAAAGARAALARTTEQLDVLARHGVVDAGAAGLCVILDAFAAVVAGDHGDLADTAYLRAPSRRHVRKAGGDHPAGAISAERGYEVMYLLDAEDDAAPALRGVLRELGESLLVVGGDGLWNVHVHVDDVGAAIEAGMEVGRPHRIRVTYLRAGSADGLGEERCRGGRGVVAMTAGAGIAGLFEGAGAVVVPREPGCIPPTGDVLEAVDKAGNEVVLLPNESQVLPVAEAAAERARDAGIQAYVIPTRASVQGLAALAVHDTDRRFDDDLIAMTSAAGATRYGEVTVATRAAVTSAGICGPGDVLGLIDGDVSVITRSVAETATAVVDRMLSGGGELVTLITGSEAESEATQRIVRHVREVRPDVDVVVYDGGQAKYPLLIGVE